VRVGEGKKKRLKDRERGAREWDNESMEGLCHGVFQDLGHLLTLYLALCSGLGHGLRHAIDHRINITLDICHGLGNGLHHGHFVGLGRALGLSMSRFSSRS
jgi:hypothetical protein